ncbi:unnamed protein product [Pylaiella littoralis]
MRDAPAAVAPASTAVGRRTGFHTTAASPEAWGAWESAAAAAGGAPGGGGGCPLEGTIDELLEELGLAKYLHIFRNAEVDLSTLCIMSEQDFRELGILKGPRVKIMHHIGSR